MIASLIYTLTPQDTNSAYLLGVHENEMVPFTSLYKRSPRDPLYPRGPERPLGRVFHLTSPLYYYEQQQAIIPWPVSDLLMFPWDPSKSVSGQVTVLLKVVFQGQITSRSFLIPSFVSSLPLSLSFSLPFFIFRA